jgi:hypothetical protein
MVSIMRSADALGFHGREIAMTRIAATSGSVATHFDSIFSTVVASCADFCGSARQGRDIEARYHTLNRLSGQPGMTQTDDTHEALTDTRH